MKSQRGGVSVELALVLPAVLALATVLATLGAAALSQVRCADAARTAARQAALGVEDAQIRSTAQQLAGPKAQVSVERSNGQVSVWVEQPVPLIGRVLSASAMAVAPCEPTLGCW